MSAVVDRARGGLWGLLVGDALGVPYEFHPPAEIPPPEQVEFEPPAGYRRAHWGVPPGTWSDDGAQALCLVDALLESPAGDFYGRLSDNLVRWRDEGFMAVNRSVFDIGSATNSAINRLRERRDDGRSAGGTEDHCNGNGALMRVLPLALWEPDPDRLVEQAMQQSRLTHGHPVSQLCCAIYCLWIRGLMVDDPAAWTRAIATVRAGVSGNLAAAMPRVERELQDEPGGSGYVVDCLRSARWAVEAPSFEDSLRRAISLGFDTDTTACVAGGAAGLIHGAAAIPPRWLQGLRGREVAEPLIDRFVERLN